jgi:hypothetical protein
MAPNFGAWLLPGIPDARAIFLRRGVTSGPLAGGVCLKVFETPSGRETTEITDCCQ